MKQGAILVHVMPSDPAILCKPGKCLFTNFCVHLQQQKVLVIINVLRGTLCMKVCFFLVLSIKKHYISSWYLSLNNRNKKKK